MQSYKKEGYIVRGLLHWEIPKILHLHYSLFSFDPCLEIPLNLLWYSISVIFFMLALLPKYKLLVGFAITTYGIDSLYEGFYDLKRLDKSLCESLKIFLGNTLSYPSWIT